MAFLFKKKRTAKKEEGVLQRVAGMVRDREAQKLATNHGLRCAHERHSPASCAN